MQNTTQNRVPILQRTLLIHAVFLLIAEAGNCYLNDCDDHQFLRHLHQLLNQRHHYQFDFQVKVFQHRMSFSVLSMDHVAAGHLIAVAIDQQFHRCSMPILVVVAVVSSIHNRYGLLQQLFELLNHMMYLMWAIEYLQYHLIRFYHHLDCLLNHRQHHRNRIMIMWIVIKLVQIVI